MNFNRNYHSDKYNVKTEKLLKDVKLRLLNFEIGDTFLAIKRCNTDLHKFEDSLKKTVNETHYNELFKITNNRPDCHQA